MKKYSTNQYVEIFYKLPPEIKDVVASSATTTKLWEIGQNHKLHVDAIGNMTDIVMDVIMGIIPSKNIVNEISENCGISKIDASIVVRDIDDQILRPIKELMRRLYEDGAPFKPDSMNTVDEKDEDHSHLDKHEILRDIENPTAAEVKTVVSSKFQVGKEEPKPPQENFSKNFKGQEASAKESFVTSDSKVLEEYHQEIESKEEKVPKAKPSAQTGISSIEDTKKRLLSNIAENKLSGIVTMPAQEGVTSSKLVENLSKPSLDKSSNTIFEVQKSEVGKEENKAASSSPAPKPPTPAPKPYTADPYREPTE